MSVDFEAIEAHEARNDPEYYKALADSYENVMEQPPILRIELSEREVVLILATLEYTEGVQEDESIREELETITQRFWRLGK